MMLQCKIGIGELCEELLISSSFNLDQTILMATLHNTMLVHVACLQVCICFCSVQKIGSLVVCMHCFYHDLSHVQVTHCSITILCVHNRRLTLHMVLILLSWKQ
jgi:hypothetical protein